MISRQVSPIWAFPMAQWQRIPLQYRRGRRLRLDPWVRMIPWRRKWQPTPAFLPEQSPGHGSLEGCSPGGCKESDTTVHEPTLAYRSLQPLGDLVLSFPYHVVPPQPTASGCYSQQSIETAWQRPNHPIQ